MISSLLHAWRSWKTARSVALLAVAALAVGIGSATAIFTVVYAVLLRPLPYDHPERYIELFGSWRPHPDWWTVFSYGDYRDYVAQVRTTEAFGCSSSEDFNVSFSGRPVHVAGTEASSVLMRSFGISPKIGRWYRDSDVEPSGVPEAVISASLWRRFGSDPNVLGKPLIMNGIEYTISGVMPAWFRYPVDAANNDVWVPLNPTPDQKKLREYHYLRCIAKLKPEATQQEMTQDFNRVLSGLRQRYPGQAEPDLIYGIPVLKFVNETIRPSLILLLSAAAALFLITCANVASVLLARAVARIRETAVRVALGASNWQLGVQYFSEGLLISLLGAAIGALLSFALIRLVLSIAADYIPRSDQIGLDWRVIGFAVTLAIGCAVAFSIAPLWQARRTAPNQVLSEGTRASASAQSRRLLRLFVVAEVTLAFGLLAIGGLIFEQLTSLYRVHPGFDPNNLLVANVYAPVSKYKTDESRIQYETRLLEVIPRVPGVESAGFIDLMPLTNWGNNTSLHVEGRPAEEVGHGESIEQRFVSPTYFQTMKIPLMAGRFFTNSDKEADLMPMLINQALARLYWPHSDPIGSYVRIFSFQGKRFQVVGVVGDVRNVSLAQPPRPEFYLSYRMVTPANMAWAVRSPLDAATLTRELRRAVESVDPEQSIFDVHTMKEIIENSVSRRRLESLMVSFFAAAALLLSMLGLYGVIAYAVRQRIPEMGTRMAIGATPRKLLKQILGEGLQLSVWGVGIGLVLVLALAHFLAQSVLQVDVATVPPFLFATALVAVCTVFACWFPAWRATTLSPMVAIHGDVHADSNRLRPNYRVLTERISELVSHEHQTPAAGADLLDAIADASRHAESFPDAIHAALRKLRDEMNTSSAFLFSRRTSDQPYRLTAASADGELPECILPANALLLNRLRNYSSALPIPQRDLSALHSWAEDHAPEHVAEIETLQQLGAELAVPLLSKSEMIGLLLLGAPLGRKDYSSIERRSLRSAAAQLALLLENGRLTDRIVEQERLRREMLLAAEVQRRLFPERSPETASIQLAGVCLPARGVGGDYYDFLDLGNRQIGIALADVAGKGIAAALIMSVVQASLRSLAGANGASLAELASKMNRLLYRSTGSNSYATFFYAQIDDESRRLRYVNAGHNPPFLLRNGETYSNISFAASAADIEELATGGTIIGMFAQSNYEEATLNLQSGDVLIAFSDGVTEAHSPSEEEFGEQRLKDLLRRVAHLPINDMASRILEELKFWMADAPQYDDLTFVLMKVN